GLEKTLGSAYTQCVFTLPYTRTLADDRDYLASYYKRLQEVKAKGAVLLLTPRQKHSIITSLYEAYYEVCRQSSPVKESRLEEICKICKLLQFEEVDQIDEIDSVMNSKVVFKYPLGEKKVVDSERATLLSEILIDLSLDSVLASSVSIDFVKKM